MIAGNKLERRAGIAAVSILLWALYSVTVPLKAGLPGSCRSPRPTISELAYIVDDPDPNSIVLRLRANYPMIVKARPRLQSLGKAEVRVKVRGFHSNMSPGNPILPYQIYLIALPPETKIDTLEVFLIRRKEQEIPLAHLVAPAPLQWFDQKTSSKKTIQIGIKRPDVQEKIVDGRNTSVYQNDSLYPARNCRVTYAGQIRKWKLAAVKFFPIRYNPPQNKLFLVKEMDVRIAFKRDKTYLKQKEVRSLLQDSVFDDRVEDLVLNFDQAKQWYQATLLGESLEKYEPNRPPGENKIPPPRNYNYVIFTTEKIFSESEALDDFCFHKESLGFQVVVVLEHRVQSVESDPLSGYCFVQVQGLGGYEDVSGAPRPNKRPDKVRKWLQDNYHYLGIEYVVLVGNPDPDKGDLPMKTCKPDSRPYFLWLVGDAPTDFYFAELQGDWDLDGDGDAGEYHHAYKAETWNIPEEVKPSRFCVRSAGHLEVKGAEEPVPISFEILAKDGAKIWLRNKLLCVYTRDDWPRTRVVRCSLGNGRYPVKVEYVQWGGPFVISGDASFSFRVVSANDQIKAEFVHYDDTGNEKRGLQALFFNNNDFSGPPVASQATHPKVHDFFYVRGDRGPGGVEFKADVIVGRIPIYNQNFEDLDQFLNKTIAYENARAGRNDWRRRILISCPYLSCGVAWYRWAEKLRVSFPFWEWRPIYKGGCSEDKTQLAWNDPRFKDDGRGLVMWVARGEQTLADKVFDNAMCPALDDNHPSVVFMGADYNGKPEFVPPDGIPLGFACLRNGAIATVSPTRRPYPPG